MPNIRIVAIFAIIIVAAVAGLAWPFLSNIKPVYLVPIQASQWHIGKGSEYNPEMTYQVYFNNSKFSTSLKFVPNQAGNQQLVIKINPGDKAEETTQTVQMGMVYSLKDFNASSVVKSYDDILDQTIFSMRDYATEDKFLMKDAEWGDLYIGANHEKLKITDSGKMSFKFGSAKAFLLTYRIGANINKIWIVDNLPIPVKSEIYDPNGNLQYAYELDSLKAPSTPGLIS